MLSRKQPEHVLIVDDDDRIRQMLSRYFEDEGYGVSVAGDGQAMRSCLSRGGIDIVLLDIVLPDSDGFALARDLRKESDIPIIMLTGRNDVIDRIVGLELGADDYIAKPFHLRELLARVKVALRRRSPVASRQIEGRNHEVFCFEGWRLDTARRELLSPAREEIRLTTGEFEMLCVFVKHAGRVMGRELLMDLTRGRNLEAFDRTIDAQVARLRRKIEDDPAHPSLIKSVRGVGYVFSARPERQ
ncbi:response regulator [Ensifer sp. HO-A22]|uniref:Regulatory protein VirG n=1 Tax=Ensifer oleiphilus TaxID=2742698 RepID=A0A7Y6UN87_9HYPH|nr:response regulator [Ensifer oleiphilus]NVD39917.1 response regulator [Ensifer oleiphilus]